MESIACMPISSYEEQVCTLRNIQAIIILPKYTDIFATLNYFQYSKI